MLVRSSVVGDSIEGGLSSLFQIWFCHFFATHLRLKPELAFTLIDSDLQKLRFAINNLCMHSAIRTLWPGIADHFLKWRILWLTR